MDEKKFFTPYKIDLADWIAFAVSAAVVVGLLLYFYG